MTTAFDPAETFVHLEAGGRAETIPVTPTFWEELASGLRRVDGWLVTRGRSTAPWDHWERHPEGEELILLTDGVVEMVLEWRSGEQRIRLASDRPLMIMPRGVWHTADPVEPATLTFVTFGRGTQHKPREQADRTGN